MNLLNDFGPLNSLTIKMTCGYGAVVNVHVICKLLFVLLSIVISTLCAVQYHLVSLMIYQLHSSNDVVSKKGQLIKIVKAGTPHRKGSSKSKRFTLWKQQVCI